MIGVTEQLDPPPKLGESIGDVAKRMICQVQADINVVTNFNGVLLRASTTSSISDICTQYLSDFPERYWFSLKYKCIEV